MLKACVLPCTHSGIAPSPTGALGRKTGDEDRRTQRADLQRTCKGDAGIAASREGRVQQVRITSPKDKKKSATFKRSQTNACSNAVCTFMLTDAKHQTVCGARWVHGREREHRITNWPGRK